MLDEEVVSASTPRGMMPALDGRLVAGLAVVLALAFVALARLSPGIFLGLAVIGLVLVAYAAHRWPLATLVVAAVATLADLEITPRLLPAGIDPGPIGISEPMLATAGLIVAVDAIRRGTFAGAVRDPVLPLAALFVVLAVASAVVNAAPPLVALLGIVMTVDALAMYFAVRMVPIDQRSGAAAIGAVVGAVVVASAFGIAQAVFDPHLLGFFSFEGEFNEGWRITSFLGNPNMIAAVIGLTLPFALYGSRHLADARWRWIARAALFVLVWALLLSFSRGAWLGVGLGALIGTLLLDWRSLPVLVLTVALAWGAVTVMPRDLAVRTDDAGEAVVEPPPIIESAADRLAHLDEESDTRMRFVRDGLPIISDHLLLGVGPGRYGGAAATILPSPVYDEYDTSTLGFRTVHNFWLHLLGESGVLGTAVFLTLLLSLLIRFVRGARDAVTGLRFVILAGAATTLLVAGFHSLAEMIFEGNMPVVIVWLILGIASLLAPPRPLFGPRDA